MTAVPRHYCSTLAAGAGDDRAPLQPQAARQSPRPHTPALPASHPCQPTSSCSTKLPFSYPQQGPGRLQPGTDGREVVACTSSSSWPGALPAASGDAELRMRWGCGSGLWPSTSGGCLGREGRCWSSGGRVTPGGCPLGRGAHSQRKRTYQTVSFFSCGPNSGLACARMAISQKR